MEAALLTSQRCTPTGAGDSDPREPGSCMQVQFKEFALDFDNFVVPLEPLPNAKRLAETGL